MSRPKLDGLPGAPLGGVPLLGSKPPDPVNLVVRDERGNQQIFPVVGVHLITDAARNQLGQLICSAVEAVLRHYGLIPAEDPSAPAAAPKDAGAA